MKNSDLPPAPARFEGNYSAGHWHCPNQGCTEVLAEGEGADIYVGGMGGGYVWSKIEKLYLQPRKVREFFKRSRQMQQQAKSLSGSTDFRTRRIFLQQWKEDTKGTEAILIDRSGLPIKVRCAECGRVGIIHD